MISKTPACGQDRACVAIGTPRQEKTRPTNHPTNQQLPLSATYYHSSITKNAQVLGGSVD